MTKAMRFLFSALPLAASVLDCSVRTSAGTIPIALSQQFNANGQP